MVKTYTAYSPDADMTFILQDALDDDSNLIRTEVAGFYYGKPDEELTAYYTGQTSAWFG